MSRFTPTNPCDAIIRRFGPGLTMAFGFFLVLGGFLISVSAQAICTPIAEGGGLKKPTLTGWSGEIPVRLAAISRNSPKRGSVELTYLGHSSFLIRSSGGVSAVTDYNDDIEPPMIPTIATMNIAHESHYSLVPDAEIKYVLHGWAEDGVAKHELSVGDMLVRNVPTNLRGYDGAIMGGNSIFVFETAGLCIAHLGHLHHPLSKTHLAALGMIDVLLVPVDGTFTLAQDLMAEVVVQIGPSLVIPMHVFSDITLANFLRYLKGRYTLRRSNDPTIVLSRATLPYRQLVVLPGY